MICINCLHKKTSVSNSRGHKKRPQIWRRRLCMNCHKVFTTYERPAFYEEFYVVNSKGVQKKYNPGRVFLDVLTCFEPHKEAHFDDAFWLSQSIEDRLIRLGSPIINTQVLKEAIYSTLTQFDEFAGQQYAARHRFQMKTKK